MDTSQELEAAIKRITESFAGERRLWRNGQIPPQRLLDLQGKLVAALEVTLRLEADRQGFSYKPRG